jgi:hypothetical protein
MAYSIFEYTSRANPNLLAERMVRQQWRRNKFAQWVAPNFIKAIGGKEEVKPAGPDGPKWTGAPVEVHNEFIKRGRTTLDIPVRNRLLELPVHGDKPLKGKGERAVITYRTVTINYTRKAYAPPTGMSFQIVKQFADDLVEEADRYLTDWWNDYHPSNFLLTMCGGYSRDIIAPAAEGGRGTTIMSHPNFFTAGAGQVSYAAGRPGTAAYEASVEAAVNGVTNVASDHMSPGLIENLVIEAARAKIAPIVTMNGFEFYPIWITDAQWKQLRNHADFKDWMKRLPVQLHDSPLANNAEAAFAGAVVYVGNELFAAYTNALDANVTAGTVEYGVRPTAAERALGFQIGNTLKGLDTGNIKVGLLVGQSAMSVGIGERMNFTELVDDHGFVKEIGIATIQSVVRNDIFDQDGHVSGLTAGQFHENTSSLAFATYSPHALSWS